MEKEVVRSGRREAAPARATTLQLQEARGILMLHDAALSVMATPFILPRE
jgi:hypothetical protein